MTTTMTPQSSGTSYYCWCRRRLPRLALHLLLVIVASVIAVGASTQESDGGEVDFPPSLDADDVAYFSESYDIDGLHWALTNVFWRSARNTDAAKVVHDITPTITARGGGLEYTTEYKLRMDMEQAEYLAERLEDEEERAYFRDAVAPVYRNVLGRIPPLDELDRTGGLYAFKRDDYVAGIGNLYNKALRMTDFNELKDDAGNVVPLLSDSFDRTRIERQWSGEVASDLDGKKHTGVVVVDDVLSPDALARIRQLLLESTVWYQTKMPLRFGAYAGAYIDDGLYDRILLQLAFELHRALPAIMTGHPLRYLWAYRYDSDYDSGINLHADEAAVNVNLWLTPDESNLDPDSGGLVVFTAKPPSDWDFERYNTDTDFVVEELLRPTGFANVTVPHRQNRAVIFDSALFHQTDRYNFRKGHENRRINLTLLYGKMRRGEDAEDGDAVMTAGGSAKEDL